MCCARIRYLVALLPEALGVSDFIETPADVQRRIDALTDAWNALRNAAFGRSTKPLVAASLADEVDTGWSRYRTWQQALKVNTPAWTPRVLQPSAFADELTEQEGIYNTIRAKVATALPDALVPLPIEPTQLYHLDELMTFARVALAVYGAKVVIDWWRGGRRT